MLKKSQVLALKYRPQVFEDLIGQEIVAQTIFNSLKLNKVPNAYLFNGIRGVGKTTIARIVAKALNCKNGIEKLCKNNFCENCESIANSNHIDVLEMDAASKTGVDDVRDLIEFSRYPPTTAKFKIFIVDEVHQMSKAAFNALLKTLEEPPDYLKFIFATTEIKKIPVTVVSRCQRFDLSRVKSKELFEYIKKIKDLEKGKATDEVLKLIVKISEGSVRDALSLLDRALISKSDGQELDFNNAQKIFGYFDKSSLIELFKNLFEGNEENVIRIYRSIYDKGVEPKIFLNDFLELLYYFKNITSLKLEGTNFSLNDEEFKQISELAAAVNSETMMLFWQFTIKTMDELNIVSNQNLSIEMFLIRLLYLKHVKQNNILETNNINISDNKLNDQDKLFTTTDDQNLNIKNKTISQIKNISQEEKTLPKTQLNEIKGKIEIKDFDDLINICNQKKEIKLKYELETNVNLVSFEDQRIEISFNENLDKDFVKDLSTKLFGWTNKRWIITLSKKNGTLTKKQVEKQNKQNLLGEAKKSTLYKKMIELFPDAELVDVEIKDKND
ncbi:MAG TPA: DNA polymerase III subunit gamma/tau [Candidatus Pelagibacter sp.]|nr:DNA polymerase III subunit gamma/tau [Candidatus Pelagibacter sp.]